MLLPCGSVSLLAVLGNSPDMGCKITVILCNENKGISCLFWVLLLSALLSETCSGTWNVAAAPGVAGSPSEGTGDYRQPLASSAADVGMHGPMDVEGVWCTPESMWPVVSVEPFLQKEMGFVCFFRLMSVENTACGPFSSGKLVLERG